MSKEKYIIQDRYIWECPDCHVCMSIANKPHSKIVSLIEKITTHETEIAFLNTLKYKNKQSIKECNNRINPLRKILIKLNKERKEIEREIKHERN